MARRSSDAVTDETVTDETVAEIDSAEPTDVAEVEAVDNGETEVEATEPDEVIDLSGLWAALDAVLAGDISQPSEIDYKAVSDVYATLSRKGKAAATRELSARSSALLEDGEFDKARVVLLAGKAVKASKPKSEGGTRASRTPADPTASLVEKLAAFQLAYAAVFEALPEGVDTEAIQEKVTATVNDSAREEIRALREWSDADPEERGEAPTVSAAVALAGKFAFRQTRRPYGARHNVGEHITQVFADKPVGTELTDTQIAAEKSAEYGDDTCSTSAVSARIGSNKPLGEGLEVIVGDNGKATGVRKTA